MNISVCENEWKKERKEMKEKDFNDFYTNTLFTNSTPCWQHSNDNKVK